MLGSDVCLGRVCVMSGYLVYMGLYMRCYVQVSLVLVFVSMLTLLSEFVLCVRRETLYDIYYR
jgi:hypothetical protein